jgi:hypothetical protein
MPTTSRPTTPTTTRRTPRSTKPKPTYDELLRRIKVALKLLEAAQFLAKRRGYRQAEIWAARRVLRRGEV